MYQHFPVSLFDRMMLFNLGVCLDSRFVVYRCHEIRSLSRALAAVSLLLFSLELIRLICVVAMVIGGSLA